MKRSMNLIKNELKRCFKTWALAVSVVGLFSAVMYGAVSYWAIDGSILRKGVAACYHLEALLTGLKSEAVTFFMPISCVLVYAGIYIDERGYGFLKAYLPRCGRKNYVRTKVITAACSGGVCTLVAMAIAASVLAIRFLPFETTAADNVVSVSEIMLVCGNLFLEGMLWGTVGSLFGIIYVNRYMAYGGPFLVSNILIIIVTRYLPQAYMLNPREWVRLKGDWYGIKGCSFVFLTVLTAIVMLIEKKILTKKIESIG